MFIFDLKIKMAGSWQLFWPAEVGKALDVPGIYFAGAVGASF